ncbi:MAG: hypothetical protein AMS25_14105 [Gemmatimonas sp. SM23_52]|nr:MAG: hypothetical protein AMS25_14105 [Gemmatimonas sp. SM23_52]
MRGPSRTDRGLPLDLRLRAIADNVPTSSIDQLWVFPPLPNREIACEFLVLVCYDGGPDRRRILTSHVDAQFSDPEGDELEWVQRVREHGAAPPGSRRSSTWVGARRCGQKRSRASPTAVETEMAARSSLTAGSNRK